MTDDDLPERVLAYLAKPWTEWSETYVIANSISMRGRTPTVRRALRRLQREGRVETRESWRHNMLEWKLIPFANEQPS